MEGVTLKDAQGNVVRQGVLVSTEEQRRQEILFYSAFQDPEEEDISIVSLGTTTGELWASTDQKKQNEET
jgi:hypothetical protein